MKQYNYKVIAESQRFQLSDKFSINTEEKKTKIKKICRFCCRISESLKDALSQIYLFIYLFLCQNSWF